MRIANPIYDVVFKYLLDDEKVAKILLSALLGRDVVGLDYRATEVRSEVKHSVLLLRLDFAATIQLEDGTSKVILIEIQKAQTPLDVLRFRKYLGAHYASPENVSMDVNGRRQALPLVTIYFLGEGLEHTDAPVVRINRQYLDAATGQEIPIPESFVEALTHDCIVVQINRLKDRRRTELERLLMVFDQGLAASDDPHLLEIHEEDYPERCREVIRRLIRANAEKQIRDSMDVEDEYLTALLDLDRGRADSLKALSESLNVLAERDKALEESRRAAEESRREAEESRRKAEESRQAVEEKDRLIEQLKERLDKA